MLPGLCELRKPSQAWEVRGRLGVAVQRCALKSSMTSTSGPSRSAARAIALISGSAGVRCRPLHAPRHEFMRPCERLGQLGIGL